MTLALKSQGGLLVRADVECDERGLTYYHLHGGGAKPHFANPRRPAVTQRPAQSIELT